MKKWPYAVVIFIFIFSGFTLLGCNTSSDTDHESFTHELEKNGGVRAIYTIKDFEDRKITDSQFQDAKEIIEKSFSDVGYKNIYVSLDQSKYIVVELVWDDNCKSDDVDRAFFNITQLQDIELEINTIKPLSPNKK